MPTVPKTSTSEVLAAARRILEQEGEQAVTMQTVAASVGIRGPSLYKRFPDREAILAALERETFARLGRVLRESGDSPRALVDSYLAFARANPVAYRLLFRSGDPADAAEAARPALEMMEKFIGDRNEALVRTRVLTSFLHGYLLIEASGGFRLGGEPLEVIEAGLDLILPKTPLRKRL